MTRKRYRMSRKRYRMTRNRYAKTSNPCTESRKRYGEASKRLRIASKEDAGSSEGNPMRAERFWVPLDDNGPPRCCSDIGA